MTVELDLLPERYTGPQPIGRGGMGEIFRATDTTLGRAVAIKLLDPRFAQDEAVRERFTREALAVARLSGNSNIVTIYDVGEWRGRPFIVMEYLGGGSLQETVTQGGAQPAGRALEWLEQAAGALDAAHREGVVHRDVKPANLLLDRHGRVHVADFGIASATGLNSLTQTGTVLGTASYLSPEQAKGERATPASDLYSLGVVAFELLTGRRPFEGDSVAAEAAAHVTGAIPSVCDVNPAAPCELDPVFARALAKDPAERYGSGAELVAALRGALDDEAGATRALGARACRRGAGAGGPHVAQASAVAPAGARRTAARRGGHRRCGRALERRRRRARGAAAAEGERLGEDGDEARHDRRHDRTGSDDRGRRHDRCHDRPRDHAVHLPRERRSVRAQQPGVRADEAGRLPVRPPAAPERGRPAAGP